jgi:hypothetical protein
MITVNNLFTCPQKGNCTFQNYRESGILYYCHGFKPHHLVYGLERQRRYIKLVKPATHTKDSQINQCLQSLWLIPTICSLMRIQLGNSENKIKKLEHSTCSNVITEAMWHTSWANLVASHHKKFRSEKELTSNKHFRSHISDIKQPDNSFKGQQVKELTDPQFCSIVPFPPERTPIKREKKKTQQADP